MNRDEIWIVGLGCVLPGAPDVSAFWRLLRSGTPQFRPMDRDRLETDLYLSSSIPADDRSGTTYTNFAASIDRESLASIGARLKEALEVAHVESEPTRLDCFAWEATRQAMACLGPDGTSFLSRHGNVLRSGIILGSMNQDESISAYEFLKEWPALEETVQAFPERERHLAKEILGKVKQKMERVVVSPTGVTVASTSLRLLQSQFGFGPEGFFVDAACASSFAAIDIAMARLRSGELDFVLSGGVEANLSPESFALFARLGVLASSISTPLASLLTTSAVRPADGSRHHDGMLQGEGAAVFVLMRAGDARRYNLTPHARLIGCAGATSVRSSALFAPDALAQVQAITQARRMAAHYQAGAVTAIECHATGTSIGDDTEIAALSRGYSDLEGPVPIASVKALLGHTKSAAGAVGLLKAIMMIGHQEVPPLVTGGASKNWQKLKPADSTAVMSRIALPSGSPFYLPLHMEPLANEQPAANSAKSELLTVAVNAAGFGGINYHCLVSESPPYKTAEKVLEGAERAAHSLSATKVILTDEAMVRCDGGVEEVRKKIIDAGFKIPPASLQSIDQGQLLALLAVHEVVTRTRLTELVDGSRVAVISASSDALPMASDLSRRVRYNEFLRPEFGEVGKRLSELRETLPVLTEDTGPGILNNVLASRVAQNFGFSGPSFNIDAELVCFPYAINVARTLLIANEEIDAIVVIGHERYLGAEPLGYLSAPAASAQILMREADAVALGFAQKLELGPIFSQAQLDAAQTPSSRQRRLFEIKVRRTREPVCQSSDWQSCFGDRIYLSKQVPLIVPKVNSTASHSKSAKPQGGIVLFTGQGANHPGMFRQRWSKLGLFSTYFKRADQAAIEAGLRAPSLYLLNPEELSQTDAQRVQNIALFTAQVAMFSEQSEQVKPSVLSAHSFGEFGMLVSAGIVAFDDALAFVIAREKLAPSANTLGSLIAVVASAESVFELQNSTGSLPAIYNSSSSGDTHTMQVVFAVAKSNVTSFLATCESLGITARILNVPQPYHSQLLTDYQEALNNVFSKLSLKFSTPHCAVVSSVLRQGKVLCIHTDDSRDVIDEKVSYIFRNQLLSQVNFPEQIHTAMALTASRHFLEIGPRPVLLPFVGAVYKSHATNADNEPHGEPLTLSNWNEYYPAAVRAEIAVGDDSVQSKIISLVSKVIAKVTGYKLEGISVEDRMQDDLGIDSIKKAEIVFTTLGQLQREVASDIDLASMKRVKDIVDYLAASQPAAERTEENESTRFRLSRIVQREIPELADRIYLREQSIETPVKRATCWADWQVIYLEGRFDIAQIVAKLATAPSGLLMVLMNFDPIHGPAVAGLLRGWVRETPGAKALLVSTSRFEMGYLPPTHWRRLCDATRFTFIEDVGTGFYEQPLIEQLEQEEVKLDHPYPMVWVVFGGAKGITRALLSDMLNSKRPSALYIAGRSESGSPSVCAALDSFAKSGVDVKYFTCDATNAGAVEELFQTLEARHPKKSFLIINGAGIEISRSLVEKSPDEVTAEWAGKFSVAKNIQTAAAKLPGYLVHFTSVVGVWGNRGQAVYDAANAAIHGLVHESSSRNVCAAIAWPPWNDVGMTSDPLIRMSLKAAGLRLLDTDEAAKLFRRALDRIIANSKSEVLVVSDHSDRHLYQSPLIDWQGSSPPWTAWKVTPSGLELSSNWDANRPEWEILSDHKVQGLCYVPQAWLIQIIFDVAAKLFGLSTISPLTAPITIQKLEVLHPIILGKEPLPVKLTVSPQIEPSREDNTASWEITIATHVLCLRVIVSPSVNRRMSQSTNNKEISGMTTRQIARGNIYGRGGLFHGPRLRVLSSITKTLTASGLDSYSGLLCKPVVTSASGKIALQELVLAKLDGVMQLAAFATSDITGMAALPIGCHAVQSFPALVDKVTCDWVCAVERMAKPDSAEIGSSSSAGIEDFHWNAVIMSDGVEILRFDGLTIKTYDLLDEESSHGSADDLRRRDYWWGTCWADVGTATLDGREVMPHPLA